MIDDLINRMKQAYRDLESGQATYARAQVRAEELTPQVGQAVPYDPAAGPQPAQVPAAPAASGAAPAAAPAPSLLDILASR